MYLIDFQKKKKTVFLGAVDNVRVWKLLHDFNALWQATTG